jgi:uncharacterized C2H2 Zn-finger protein
MALKCVTCGLLFRSRNELDWHIRQEHLQQRLPPTRDSRRRARLRPRTGGERHVSAVRKPDIRVRRVYEQPSPANGTRVLVDQGSWPRTEPCGSSPRPSASRSTSVARRLREFGDGEQDGRVFEGMQRVPRPGNDEEVAVASLPLGGVSN